MCTAMFLLSLLCLLLLFPVPFPVPFLLDVHWAYSLSVRLHRTLEVVTWSCVSGTQETEV